MQVFLIIAVFVIFAFLMMSKKLPALISLPTMAVLIAIISRLNATEILNDIIGKGSVKLSIAIITTIFGAVFAQVINKTNISSNIIRYAAEFGGDNPMFLAIILTLATALIFTSVSGLGSVIMVGSIILPILISVGIKPLVAGTLLILGLNMGGLFNLANYTFYSEVLGIDIDSIKQFSLMLGSISFFVILIYILFNVKREKTVFHCKTANNTPFKKLKWYSLLTPIIPLIFVFAWPHVFSHNLDVIGAICIGILYAIITTNPRKIKTIFIQSFLDGIGDASPAIALMIGIGILLQAVTNKEVSSIISPILLKVLPTSKVTYVIIFFLLSPFALFRGPLNLFGLGSGIASLMISSNALNPLAILGALMSIGAIQGICDPTNTHNVWVSNYINDDASKILKKTLPYALAQVLINLILISIFFV